MVSKKADKRKAIKKKSTTKKMTGNSAKRVERKVSAKKMVVRRRTLRDRFGKWWWVFIFGLFLLVAMSTVVEMYRGSKSGDVRPEENPVEEAEEPLDVEEVSEVPAINLQPVVDKWAASVSGNKSVLIYDLEREEVVGEYNTKEKYGTASLYKLFVVYEGYRRVQSGTWNGETKAGTTGKTINKCLDLAVRESHSPCAETLWGMIGHDRLDEIMEKDFKITNSDISKLVSNANDIMEIMKIFYEHREITDEKLVAAMKDSFLNQPKTTYDWRQGLPSGFSKSVNVYNKVGWEYNSEKKRWNIYHDAAIIEFPESDRHFIVVVMTNYIDYKKIAQLGTSIEKAILEEN